MKDPMEKPILFFFMSTIHKMFTPIIIYLNKISSTFILLSEDILSVLIVRITHFSTFKFVNLFSSKSILITQFL